MREETLYPAAVPSKSRVYLTTCVVKRVGLFVYNSVNIKYNVSTLNTNNNIDQAILNEQDRRLT